MDTADPQNPMTTPGPDEPPLHRAARVGDDAEIRRLVQAGARLDQTFNTETDPGAYPRDATPFMVAAGSVDGADVETLRVLLELGSDPKLVINARSAATFACEGLSAWQTPARGAERLRFVLSVGSPLPTDPARANHLLCDTARAGDADRVRILLEQGLSARGHWDPAVTRANLASIARPVDRSTGEGSNARERLPEALQAGFDEMLSELYAKMFEEQCSGPSQLEIPLFCAAASGSAECVRLLIAAGADPLARDSSQRTALYHAGSEEVVRLLIEAGNPLEDRDKYGWTPLYSAVTDGEEALPRIRGLVAAGANVNATHDRGYSVFMSAVGSGRHPQVLRFLISAGADPHMVSELGYNAFHAAIDVNFEANAEESVRGTLGYLRELGVNLELRNKMNQTPLARAIQEGTGLEVRVLCELGADVNAVCPKHECSEESCTRVDQPLLFHAATGIGVHRDVKTEALLRAGADPLVEDSEGFTPLMHAVASLCRSAADVEATYRAFFQGLRDVTISGEAVPPTRAEFVEQATPAVRAYVERFADSVPLESEAEHEDHQAMWRREMIGCVTALAVHEIWARRQRRAAGS